MEHSTFLERVAKAGSRRRRRGALQGLDIGRDTALGDRVPPQVWRDTRPRVHSSLGRRLQEPGDARLEPGTEATRKFKEAKVTPMRRCF